MKYAHYEAATGKLLGWYDDEIHGTLLEPAVLNEDGSVKTPAKYDISAIPTPNIPVSDADWQTAIDNGYNYVDATTRTLSVKDLRTFEERQQAKINELKAVYQSAINADITYMNTTFQADQASQDMITKVLAASGGVLPDGFFWLDSFNNQVAMTYADLQGLANAILLRGQEMFSKYQSLKAQALAATNDSELGAIVW